jgi:hypothetical protein
MLLRMLMRLADLNVDAALAVLAQVEAHPRHRFWPDVLSYGDVAGAA